MNSIILVTLLTWLLPAQQPTDDLDTVVRRAAVYVAQYEADLGNLIGKEDYIQNSTWFGGPRGQVARRLQRRVSSDFLIVQVGKEWNALRKINVVDGMKEKQAEPSFE